MESLEPWNMFTNDFVAEETDEILTDAILAEHRRSSEEAQVKEEPKDDSQDDNMYNDSADGLLESYNNSTSFAADVEGEDDNAIFNFGLEPTGAIATPVLRSTYGSLRESSPQDNYDDMPINYEAAVVYICPACGLEYNAQDNWKRHMNGVHNYNTRRGLNFVQVDKLYHECLECHKRIAMHAMENLLKHKFTHLPYRCTKCKICLRQYKYRQDLMVHLRMTHRDDLLAIARSTRSDADLRGRTPNSEQAPVTNSARSTPLEIKDIKENAVDIFENTFEAVAVKNELIEPDESDIDNMAERASNSFVLPSFLEDALSRSSSHASELQSSRVTGGRASDEGLCEKYIQYICPQCGEEYESHAPWHQHIKDVHDYGTRKGLNFQEINKNQHAKCLECNKIVFINSLRSLQLHKFGHLPHKSCLRCKLCVRAFVGHKEIVKHLMKQHRLGGDYNADESLDERSSATAGGGDDDVNEFADDSLLTEHSSKGEDRDVYEAHIDYLCPQCGKEFLDKKLWRKHIVKTHHLTDLQVLNFKVINERQVMCLECDKVITNAYGVQNAQQHRITHMPFKAFIRCRFCTKSYTDRKGLVKHLRSVHSIGDDTGSLLSMSLTPATTPQQYIRPLPPLLVRPQKRPVKEIVKHADVTYEIQYLDDDDDGTDTMQDDATVPELSFGRSFEHFSRRKCVDCGSIFATQKALQIHVQEEHEFLDFNNLKPLTESPGKMESTSHSQAATSTHRHRSSSPYRGEHSNDADAEDDELLVIAAAEEEDVSNSSASASSSSIERNFCYLCPACGLGFRAQIDWRRHINEAHNFDKRHFLSFRPIDKFRHQCTECKDIVSSSKLKGLQDHKFRHLPFKLYIKCLLCSICYNHKPNMVSHLRIRHKIVDTRLAAVGASERDYEYMQHPRAHPRSLTMPANSTPLSSNKPPGLKTAEECISFHNAVDHDSITYFCPQCNENFDSHAFWRKHIVDMHNFNSRHGLNFRQIDEHHYLCLQCYKRVTVTHTKGAIGQLQSHKFRHLPHKSFKCLHCHGEFVRKQMFFKHLNRRTNCCDCKPSSDNNEPLEENTVAEATPLLEEPATSGTSETLIVNQATFSLVCPQCGEQFDSWRTWREHINIVHELGKRDKLHFRRLQPMLHQCLDCHEHVSGKKLRDLQIHRFKHLPYGAYLQCNFCPSAYQHIRNMKNHLQQKHPNVVQKHDEYTKMEELQQFEEQEEEDNSPPAHVDSDAAGSKQNILAKTELQAEEKMEEELDMTTREPDEQYLLG